MPATLSPDDLKSAVEAGVIDAAQAEKLKAMSAAPNASAPAYADMALADEEHFRFLNGFNDVFLTIGVLLVAGALVFAATPQFSGSVLGVMTLAAAIFWILSEILVRRLRAVLPGIALSILFVAFAATAIVIQLHSRVDIQSTSDPWAELAFWRYPSLLFSVPALAAAVAYYLRFRLPFALALIALAAYGVFRSALHAYGVAEGADMPFIAFASGLVILAVAMAYDAQDLKRTTRFSDCAFWLHLVAAPLIVSPVITLIKQSTADSGTTSSIVLMAVFALGLFALAIDRRALLVSSLLYFTVAVYDLLSRGSLDTSTAMTTTSLVMTLALVGGFVLILGVFWHPLRQRLLPLVQNIGLSRYLPPARQ
jgi:hypothetical protein